VLLVVSPTNKCNLNCEYCCFDDRDKGLELDFEFLKESLQQFKKLGIKSVELAGGGQPTLYKYINEFIDFVHDDLQLDLGMIFNYRFTSIIYNIIISIFLYPINIFFISSDYK